MWTLASDPLSFTPASLLTGNVTLDKLINYSDLVSLYVK